MKRFLFSLCFLAAFHGAAMAQERLEPADSFYDTNVNEDYYRTIKDHLISAEEGVFMSRFWVLPSFEKEYFVGTKREGEDFFLIYRTPEAVESIWSDGKFHDNTKRYIPKIVEIKRPISEKDVVSLNLLIEVAVAGARFDHEIQADKDVVEIKMRFDGETYFFSTCIYYPVITATIWSPRPDSRTGRLIALLEEVVEAAKNGDIKFNREFRARIAELTEEFRADI